MINEDAVRHFLEQGVGQVRAFSGDEEGMTALRNRLQATDSVATARVKYYIGDVNAPAYLAEAMDGADFVLYAPTIPSSRQCDEHPAEACTALLDPVNTVMQTAIQQKVQKLVVLAPSPETFNVERETSSVNCLLAALLEKVVIAQARYQGQDSPTAICCVRLWNDLKPETWRSALPLGSSKNLKPMDFAFAEGQNGDLVEQNGGAYHRIPCPNPGFERNGFANESANE